VIPAPMPPAPQPTRIRMTIPIALIAAWSGHRVQRLFRDSYGIRVVVESECARLAAMAASAHRSPWLRQRPTDRSDRMAECAATAVHWCDERGEWEVESKSSGPAHSPPACHHARTTMSASATLPRIARSSRADEPRESHAAQQRDPPVQPGSLTSYNTRAHAILTSISHRDDSHRTSTSISELHPTETTWTSGCSRCARGRRTVREG